jgi:hypothetical protein
MELEKQVCSLVLAKRLKELGVKQESYFVWFEFPMLTPTVMRREELRPNSESITAAFTVAELGEMLPCFVDGLPLGISADRKSIYTRNDNGTMKTDFSADTEADARAKILVDLIENKLLTV